MSRHDTAVRPATFRHYATIFIVILALGLVFSLVWDFAEAGYEGGGVSSSSIAGLETDPVWLLSTWAGTDTNAYRIILEALWDAADVAKTAALHVVVSAEIDDDVIAATGKCVQVAGDTMTGALRTTRDQLSSAPASDEFITGEFGRSLLSFGKAAYMTANPFAAQWAPTNTTAILSYDNPSPVTATVTVAADTYVRTMVDTNPVAADIPLQGPATFHLHVTVASGSPAANYYVTFKPEVYYTYDLLATNLTLGDFSAEPQTWTDGESGAKDFVISWQSVQPTGIYYRVYRLKCTAKGSAIATVDVNVGGTLASYMTYQTAGAEASAVDAKLTTHTNKTLAGGAHGGEADPVWLGSTWANTTTNAYRIALEALWVAADTVATALWDTRDKVEAVWAGVTTIWCDDNDGTGSGLDADLLDGVELSTLVPRTETNGMILPVTGYPEAILTGGTRSMAADLPMGTNLLTNAAGLHMKAHWVLRVTNATGSTANPDITGYYYIGGSTDGTNYYYHEDGASAGAIMAAGEGQASMWVAYQDGGGSEYWLGPTHFPAAPTGEYSAASAVTGTVCVVWTEDKLLRAHHVTKIEGPFDVPDMAAGVQASLALGTTSVQPDDPVTDLDGTAYRTLVINSAGDVTEVEHGAAGKIWTAKGASATPEWSDAPAGGSVTNMTDLADLIFTWVGQTQVVIQLVSPDGSVTGTLHTILDL